MVATSGPNGLDEQLTNTELYYLLFCLAAHTGVMYVMPPMASAGSGAMEGFKRHVAQGLANSVLWIGWARQEQLHQGYKLHDA